MMSETAATIDEHGTAWCPTCGHKMLVDGDNEPTCTHCASEQPQETADEHNPLPWYVKDGKGVMLGSSGKKDSIFICDRSAGTWVAELPAGKESEANAEFIITAVNSHAELVAALELARLTIDALTDDLRKANVWDNDGGEQVYTTREALEQINTALAKARQKD